MSAGVDRVPHVDEVGRRDRPEAGQDRRHTHAEGVRARRIPHADSAAEPPLQQTDAPGIDGLDRYALEAAFVANLQCALRKDLLDVFHETLERGALRKAQAPLDVLSHASHGHGAGVVRHRARVGSDGRPLLGSFVGYLPGRCFSLSGEAGVAPGRRRSTCPTLLRDARSVFAFNGGTRPFLCSCVVAQLASDALSAGDPLSALSAPASASSLIDWANAASSIAPAG